jgi:hypothetical protein
MASGRRTSASARCSLLGDRVHVISGGQRTILDRTSGALAAPLADPGSRSQPGVTLVVPYRQADDGPLRVFGPRQEAEALQTIIAELAPTLIKLAHPSRGKNLRAVVLRSARLGARAGVAAVCPRRTVRPEPDQAHSPAPAARAAAARRT